MTDERLSELEVLLCFPAAPEEEEKKALNRDRGSNFATLQAVNAP